MMTKQAMPLAVSYSEERRRTSLAIKSFSEAVSCGGAVAATDASSDSVDAGLLT